MKYQAAIGLAALVCPMESWAGGLDRSGQGVNILFEEGNALQFSLAYSRPDTSGTLDGVESGNVTNSFVTPHAAYKHAVNDQLDIALIYDQPFGADVDYASDYPLSINPVPGQPASSLTASSNTDALTALVRYKFDNGFSVIGGVRGQRSDASVTLPAFFGYNLETNNPIDFGYVAGVAWEKPEIAARVSLVYSSKITADFEVTETQLGGVERDKPFRGLFAAIRQSGFPDRRCAQRAFVRKYSLGRLVAVWS